MPKANFRNQYPLNFSTIIYVTLNDKFRQLIIQIQMTAFKQIKERLNEIPDLANAEELDLSEIKIGRFTEQIKKHLQKYKKVNVVYLRECDLQSLQHFPNWKLNAVDLSYNNLHDDAIPSLVSFTQINQILCVGNQISSLDSLKALVALKSLSQVDFSENPVSAISSYRDTLFATIPSLQVVDRKDKDGNVLEDEQEFEDGSEQDEEQWGDGDEDSQDYQQEEELSSEKPKKKKK